MCTAMHVILIHRHEILERLPLPIGFFSEEAQESNNKNVKKSREFHSRKTSRYDTNSDVFHRLLTASDPLVTLTRKFPERKEENITEDMRKLLIIDEDDSNDENDSDNDFENVPDESEKESEEESEKEFEEELEDEFEDDEDEIILCSSSESEIEIDEMELDDE
ncbi:hypothetical protein TKK_0015364 [Trichogramma kaykai]